jgi:nicotinate dehydrogenase subunit A
MPADQTADSNPVALRVNGQSVVLRSPRDSALLYALRDELSLTGTHYGCGANQCGACHVMLDGKAVASCDTPLWAVAGKSIVTIEGLGSAGQPHPLQQAFLEEQAGQCGYCLSGILISAAALLAVNPDPDEAQIRAALQGNLCRCGAHNRMLRAVRLAAQRMREVGQQVASPGGAA